jgi:putative acyl-CoA dehydrogenase
MTGIHPHNQAPELKDYNVYTSDPVLQRAVTRGGAQWRDPELQRQGAEYGAEATLRAAEEANHFEPELHTHSPSGDRIDQVRFHPAWHQMMTIARRNGISNLPFTDKRQTAWAAYGASLFMHSQIESGSTCPTTMTKASIPLVRINPQLNAVLGPLLESTDYDARDIPAEGKRSITVGMGMTERQGGSDVRSNTTRAVALNPSGSSGPWGEEYLITGHKWFFSAPMCDGHLVLAKTEERGPTCFFVPRWRPDGSKNAIHIQRLKDKVGNRSNSSSEVEFDNAWGVLIGQEGRGISTIIEMATYTRLDCALSSAGFMRQALVQALHYTRNRHAFGLPLAEQPVMTGLLADMALESEAATWLAMDLAARFGSEDPWIRPGAASSRLPPSSGTASVPWATPAKPWKSSAATAMWRPAPWGACSAKHPSTPSGRGRATSCAWMCCAPLPATRTTPICCWTICVKSARRKPCCVRRWTSCARPSPCPLRSWSARLAASPSAWPSRCKPR